MKLPSPQVSRSSPGHDSIEQPPPEQASVQVPEVSHETVQPEVHVTSQVESPRQTTLPPPVRSPEPVAWSSQNAEEESPSSTVQVESPRHRAVLLRPPWPVHAEPSSHVNVTSACPATRHVESPAQRSEQSTLQVARQSGPSVQTHERASSHTQPSPVQPSAGGESSSSPQPASQKSAIRANRGRTPQRISHPPRARQ